MTQVTRLTVTSEWTASARRSLRSTALIGARAFVGGRARSLTSPFASRDAVISRRVSRWTSVAGSTSQHSRCRSLSNALASPFRLRRPMSVGGLAAAARPPAPGACFSVARYFSLHHTAVSFVSSDISVLRSQYPCAGRNDAESGTLPPLLTPMMLM